MVRLTRLEKNQERDALLSRSTKEEIARLTIKNKDYEARLNQFETVQGLASRGQQEQHAMPSSSNEIKQRFEK